jgi:hypothetical protein
MQKLSKVQLNTLKFNSTEQIIDFFNKVKKDQEKKVKQNLTQEEFFEIISDNLKISEHMSIAAKNLPELIKGINYRIYEKNNVSVVADLLHKIAIKHKLIFSKVTIPYNNKLKISTLSIKKYLSPPFGNLNNSSIETIPILVPYVLKNLEGNVL